ncbi:MAG: hypothetical protein IKP10_05600 [Clostridia bacterium]|nr:hypothetical protein [Clostridia bacterium]
MKTLLSSVLAALLLALLAAAVPPPETLVFKVAGVTHVNDDGTDRQVVLRHLRFGDAPYAGEGGPAVTLVPAAVDGDPAVRCLVNGWQIGWVPKDLIGEVSAALERGAFVSGFRITGGGFARDGSRLYFGAVVTLTVPYTFPLHLRAPWASAP